MGKQTDELLEKLRRVISNRKKYIVKFGPSNRTFSAWKWYKRVFSGYVFQPITMLNCCTTCISWEKWSYNNIQQSCHNEHTHFCIEITHFCRKIRNMIFRKWWGGRGGGEGPLGTFPKIRLFWYTKTCLYMLICPLRIFDGYEYIAFAGEGLWRREHWIFNGCVSRDLGAEAKGRAMWSRWLRAVLRSLQFILLQHISVPSQSSFWEKILRCDLAGSVLLWEGAAAAGGRSWGAKKLALKKQTSKSFLWQTNNQCG